MELTWFILLIFPIFYLMRKPKVLLLILLFSLTLQITSILNISDINYSLRLYRFINIIFVIYFLFVIYQNNLKIKFQDYKIKKLISFFSLFVFFSFSYSIIAPLIFEGILVYPPWLGIDYSAEYGPSSLKVSIYSFSVIIFILLYYVNLLSILALRFENDDIKNVKKVLNFSFLIVLLTSISQIISYNFNVFDITKIFYSIITLGNYSLDIIPGINLPRVQGTYEEPSMMSPFIVGMFIFYLSSLLYNGMNLKDFVFSFSAFLLIFLSASSTAIIGAISSALIVLVFSIKIFTKIKNIMIVGILFCIFIIVFTIYLTDILDTIINFSLLSKFTSGSFINRTTADIHALRVFIETFMLGVGLGNNRPSSLLTYLLSQVGLIGTALFIISIIKIMRYCYFNLKESKYFPYFFLLPSCVICQIIAYPDITNPTLWQFIYVTIIVSLAASKERIQKEEVKSNENIH